MVSFIEIVRRLLPGDYATSTGTPDSPENFESFVSEVRKKVPELRDREDWEVENTAIEAVEWAVGNICKQLKSRDYSTPEYYEGVTLYECIHPETGRFYLVHYEEENAIAASGYLGFTLTRDRRKAEKSYREAEEEIEEKEREAAEVW